MRMDLEEGACFYLRWILIIQAQATRTPCLQWTDHRQKCPENESPNGYLNGNLFLGEKRLGSSFCSIGKCQNCVCSTNPRSHNCKSVRKIRNTLALTIACRDTQEAQTLGCLSGQSCYYSKTRVCNYYSKEESVRGSALCRNQQKHTIRQVSAGMEWSQSIRSSLCEKKASKFQPHDATLLNTNL